MNAAQCITLSGVSFLDSSVNLIVYRTTVLFSARGIFVSFVQPATARPARFQLFAR